MAKAKTGEPLQKIETRLRSKVSSCISSLEIVLAKWKASKKKPAELEGKIDSYRKFHFELSEWLDESVRGGSEPGAVAGRLERFVAIMHAIDAERGSGKHGA
jgi:hypothetical protein